MKYNLNKATLVPQQTAITKQPH